MIHHLVPPTEWPAEWRADGYYRPASLDREGFVHFSSADQLAASADRHFADADRLLVVTVDPNLLDVPVVIEDSYGTGTAYPHVYAPIPRAAVVAVRELDRVDGRWTISPVDVPSADASPDR